MFQFEFKGRKKVSQLKRSQAGEASSYLQEGQPFCALQAFNWLGKAHPH